MEVYGDIDGIPQAFTHALHIFDRAIDFCIGLDPFVVVIGKADLEARHSLLQSGLAQARQIFSRAYVFHVVVTPYATLIVRSTQELINRDVQSFAANIPQSLINARDGRPNQRARAVEGVHIHGLPEMLDLHGIVADKKVAKVFDAGHG